MRISVVGRFLGAALIAMVLLPRASSAAELNFTMTGPVTAVDAALTSEFSIAEEFEFGFTIDSSVGTIFGTAQGVCFTVDDLGLQGRTVAAALGLTPAAISQARRRGRSAAP